MSDELLRNLAKQIGHLNDRVGGVEQALMTLARVEERSSHFYEQMLKLESENENNRKKIESNTLQIDRLNRHKAIVQLTASLIITPTLATLIYSVFGIIGIK